MGDRGNKLYFIVGLLLLSHLPIRAAEDERLLIALTSLNALAPGPSSTIADWDFFEWQRSETIAQIAQKMAKRNYCYTASPHWVNEVQTYQAEAPAKQFFTALDTYRLSWAWQDAFVKIAFEKLMATGVSSLRELMKASTPKDRPINIIFWGRAEKAGFHRTARHVGLNPDLMEGGESLLLMVHELAHRSLYSLEADEKAFRALHTKINVYVQAKKYQAREFPPRFAQYVRDYVRLGLELQFLNEWRVWATTFSIYLKVKNARAHYQNDLPWRDIDWVDDILAQRRPGEDIKTFTFRFLDGRFVDPHDPERPFLDEVLKQQRETLRQKIAGDELDLRELEKIFTAS